MVTGELGNSIYYSDTQRKIYNMKVLKVEIAAEGQVKVFVNENLPDSLHNLHIFSKRPSNMGGILIWIGKRKA
jgi:hypothetical protein